MPSPRRSLTRDSLRAHLEAHAFRPGRSDRVGVEVELTPLALGPEGVDRLWADLSGPNGKDPFAWRGGFLSMEPGGQIELSGPPAVTPEEAASTTDRAVRALRASAHRRGVELMAVGLHPWATPEEVGLRNARPRYRAMQHHFDAISPFGRRMMRLTGSVQVNIDLGRGREPAERWELAQRLAPILWAAFANSAVVGGRPGPLASHRGEAWLHLDPARTGFPPASLDDPGSDPVDQYLDFALAAPVMFVARPDGSLEVPDSPVPFRAWLADGLPAGYPDPADWEAHLSTLFPDIRPRGYLEVRPVDAPGFAWLGVPILVVGHALRDPAARRDLLALLRPHHHDLPDLRRRAIHLGLSDPTLRDHAEALFRAVLPALRGPAEALVAAYADRYLRPGRTPGDELRDRVPEAGRLDPDDLLLLERDRSAAATRHPNPAVAPR